MNRSIKMFLFIMGMLLLILQFPVLAFATVTDTEGPVIQSIEIDKTDVTVGETVTVTVKATDASGFSSDVVNSVIYFNGPGQSGWKTYYLYKIDEETLAATIDVNETYANGKYSAVTVNLFDVYHNETSLYESALKRDYSNVYFNVNGGISDSEGPIIKSIEVDKTDVTVGETVTVTVKATDASGFLRQRSNIS